MLTDLQLQHAAFDLWLGAEGGDNLADLDRMKRILPLVLDDVCTVTQRDYIMEFFVGRRTVSQIADAHGVNKATVSRTINRGLDRAYRYLRFVSPLFINAPRRRLRLTHDNWKGD